MNDNQAGTKPVKVRKTNKNKGRKQSPETIAKRIATIKARREGVSPPDIVGAIATLRAAKRNIFSQVCKGQLKDLGEVELNVLLALRQLQGG